MTSKALGSSRKVKIKSMHIIFGSDIISSRHILFILTFGSHFQLVLRKTLGRETEDGI